MAAAKKSSIEKTSARVATKASKTLASKAPASVKSIAGSALSQSRTTKTTSPKVAKAAAVVLKDNRYSGVAKALAGSVLTQAPARKSAAKIPMSKKASSFGGAERLIPKPIKPKR